MPSKGVMAASKSKGLIEEFYREGGQTLYYIKPHKYKSATGGYLAAFDFKLNYHPDSTRKVLCMFSLSYDEPVKTINQVELAGKVHESIERVYVEKGKKSYTNRHEFWMDFTTFERYMSLDKDNVKIQVRFNETELSFVPKIKWKTLSEEANDKIFLPIQLNE